MSASTLDALEAAISAHVADEYDGSFISGWVVVAETTTLDALDRGEGELVVEARPLQSSYLTTGLLYSALAVDEPE